MDIGNKINKTNISVYYCSDKQINYYVEERYDNDIDCNHLTDINVHTMHTNLCSIPSDVGS